MNANLRKLIKKKKSSNLSDHIHINLFLEEIKTYLIVIERQNVELRCKAFETTINEETENVNTALFGSNNNNYEKHNGFTYLIDDDKMKEYLLYIYEWNGLTQSSNLPKTRKEYQKKARNWLNGRRSKKYGNNLFVDMLKHCKKYAEYVASIYFENRNKTETTTTTKELYYQLLIYSFLSQLCSKKITLHKSVQSTHLITKHSIISKTKTKHLLQEFLIKYHRKSFPCHRDEAIDYFTKHKIATFSEMRCKLNQIDNIIQNKDNNNNKTKQQYDASNCIESAESFITDIIKNKTINCDGTISIKINTFRTLLHIMDDLKAKYVESVQTIKLLNDKIHKLECKNNANIDDDADDLNVIREKCIISMNQISNSDAFCNYYGTNHRIMHIDTISNQQEITNTMQWSPSLQPMDNLSIPDASDYIINGVDNQKYYDQFNSI